MVQKNGKPNNLVFGSKYNNGHKQGRQNRLRWARVAHLFTCLCCPIVCLRSEFRVVVSVAISAWKQLSVCLYLQLFVGGLMSYLRYLWGFCV